MKKIVQYFNFPLESLTHKRIPLKDLINEIEPNTQDRKILENSISQIFLEAILDTRTTRIREFQDDQWRYETILVLEVTLKNLKNFSLINNCIHAVFQNPLLVIFWFGDSLIMSGSLKRINMNLRNRIVIEDIITTNSFFEDSDHCKFLESLDVSSGSYRDLKELFEDLINKILSERFIKILGFCPGKIRDMQRVKILLKDYGVVLTMLGIQEEQFKHENMMSKKMDIHIKIQEIKTSLNGIALSLNQEVQNGQN